MFELISSDDTTATDPKTNKELTVTSYIWKSSEQLYFKNNDSTVMFPMMVNMFLKVCSDTEHKLLAMKDHFLQIDCYYDENNESMICARCLNIDGLNSPEYQKLFRDNPYNTILCVINLGPLWHFFGLNPDMWNDRKIGLGIVIPGVGYLMGMEMYGRDAYPNETEDEIKTNEREDEIFILRQK